MQQPRPASAERGLTLMEIMIVVVVVGMLAAMIGPRVVPILARAGAGQAAGVVATDLEQAVSLASRQRRPVRLACNCAAGSYSVTDRGTGTVLFSRVVGGTSGDFGVRTLAFSTPQVDIFPSGQTSASLTISLTAYNVTRQVTMSTGGFVRVIR